MLHEFCGELHSQPVQAAAAVLLTRVLDPDLKSALSSPYGALPGLTICCWPSVGTAAKLPGKPSNVGAIVEFMVVESRLELRGQPWHTSR